MEKIEFKGSGLFLLHGNENDLLVLLYDIWAVSEQ